MCPFCQSSLAPEQTCPCGRDDVPPPPSAAFTGVVAGGSFLIWAALFAIAQPNLISCAPHSKAETEAARSAALRQLEIVNECRRHSLAISENP